MKIKHYIDNKSRSPTVEFRRRDWENGAVIRSDIYCWFAGGKKPENRMYETINDLSGYIFKSSLTQLVAKENRNAH